MELQRLSANAESLLEALQYLLDQHRLHIYIQQIEDLPIFYIVLKYSRALYPLRKHNPLIEMLSNWGTMFVIS